MDIFDSTVDYGQTSIIIHYEGQFSQVELMKYIVRNHRSFKNGRIVDHTEPETTDFGNNCGCIVWYFDTTMWGG